MTTLGVGIGVLAPKGKPLLLAWALIAVLNIIRLDSRPVYRSDDSKQRVATVYTLLGCLLPGWFYICKLRLWLPADEQFLHFILADKP